MNKLFFGDNLHVLREMPSSCVDLIYLDPPFNSNATYNVLYGTKRGGPSQAQAHAFQDTWTWGKDAQRALDETAERHLEAGSLLEAFQRVFPGSNMMAYLAMMAVRIVELRRVLKEEGSLYLHCDPTASHYLKVLLDAIFGPPRFDSEIVWRRYGSHNDSKTYGRVHDNILFYTKGDGFSFEKQYEEYSEEYIKERFRFIDPDGRRWAEQNLSSPNPRENLTYTFLAKNGIKYAPPLNGWKYTPERMQELDRQNRLHYPEKVGGRLRLKNYLDERLGVPVQDVWANLGAIGGTSPERLGYPTQKPLSLLERIVQASSKEGDVVLDPFCGCGTAIEAANKLKRKWIGIDITYLAIHVIEKRLVDAFGKDVGKTYELFGQPKDVSDAISLAGRDWLEFQKWAVLALGGIPKDKPGPDGGIDGVVRYYQIGSETAKRAIVSVKGGFNVGVDAVHKLKSVVEREKADIGALVCIGAPTPAMLKEIASAGEIGPKGRRVSRLQVVTVDMLFQKQPIDLPGMVDVPETGRKVAPPAKRGRKRIEGQTELLFPIINPAHDKKPNRSIREVVLEVTRPSTKRAAL